MSLRSPQQYLDSLKDGRTVYFRGERVPDVTDHPVIGLAARHASIDYQMAEDPAYRDLAVVPGEDGAAPYSRYYKLPASTDDLLARSALIEQGTTLGRTLVLLIKEIGTDALFGLHLVANEIDERLETSYLPRVQEFYRYCRDNDLALAVAQTDVKGDRAKGPAEQPHPDYYVRIVEERADGIVVRGAKTHTSYTPTVNEVIVLPTRAMAEADRDYAVSFAVPVDTPGLTLITSPFGGHLEERSPFEFPITARHKMVETTTVFEDVFVPWDRVFMCREWQFAGPLALGFVEFHRFTAISYKLPLVDALVGAAQLLADYNGIARAAHVRDKLIQLISYAETLRALTHHAALKGKERQLGIWVPDALTVNMAKYHFAHHYHQAVQHVQDIAGGLLVTAPGAEDMENPDLRPILERYYGGRDGVSARDRLAALNFVKDLTSSDYGGYQEVLAIHAEGSLEAEKLMIARSYNAPRTVELVKGMIGET
ncbi:MAG: 4-hydroxyphenylacetate 3-hydroxylase N-terminal domain-containing protein [Dehalococcoidia bacterium]